MLKHLYTVLVVLCTCLSAYSQQCEWLTATKGGISQYTGSATVDHSGNIIVAGYFGTQPGGGNAGGNNFYIGSTYFSTTIANGLLLKYNDTGGLIWAIQGNLNTSAWTYFTDVETDADDNIYVTAECAGTLDFGNGVTIVTSSSGATSLIIKYNSSGKALWVRQVPVSTGNVYVVKLTVDKNNSPYVGFCFNNSLIFPTYYYGTSNGGNDVGVVKYDSAGNFIRTATFGGIYDDIFTSIDNDSAGNIYLLGYSESDFYFGSQYLQNSAEMILKLDSVLQPVAGVKNKTNYVNLSIGPFYVGDIAVNDNGCCAVVGRFKGTTNFGTISLTSKTISQNSYLVYYDASLNALWARTENSVKITPYPEGGVTIRNNNIYFGGHFSPLSGDTLRFGGFSLAAYGSTFENFYLAKVDTLGNFLWAFTSPSVTSFLGLGVSAVNTDVNGNCIVSGNTWHSSITILNRTDTSGSHSNSIFVGKITDYSITRGYIYPGPYCAGDSIEIPFTKIGKFEPDNQFIAQLSDSAGNFNGGERELGRKTDTAGGILKGALPMFDVATGAKYRIRILATHPEVQSFYRLDTLRLLIYSKDTADAGPDITLCKGQSVTLGTKGGSKWLWSPPLFMPNISDTGNRRALVKPDTTTEYRIIISDSSGCGVTDTDYIVINVRPDLMLSAPDTIHLCKGRTATLIASAHGGDSLHYNFIWSVLNDTSVLSKNSVLQVSPDSLTIYRIILMDSCSKSDTLLVVVIPEHEFFLPLLSDTTICYGQSLAINAKAHTCDTTAVKYLWNNGLDSDPVKILAPTATTQYKLMAFDTINGSKDSALFTVTVRPPVHLSINNDTTICHGNNIQLSAVPIGGQPSTYKINWMADNSGWTDTNFTETVTPDSTTTYTAILNDGCTVKPDTARIKISVRPPLKVTVNADTIICIGETAELRAVANGGLPANWKLLWKADNASWTDNKFTETVNPVSTTNYTVVLSDNCTKQNDSAAIKVTVRPALKVTVNKDTTICYSGSINLVANTSGGLNTNHHILWKENLSSWTDTNFTLIVSPAATTTYTAVLNDNCTSNPDSAKVTVTVLPPLSIVATAKDSICQGQTLTLNATLTGGKTTAHTLNWTAIPGTFSSNQNPAVDTPAVNTSYIAKLSDNCSPNAYDTINVVVLPKPKADFSLFPAAGCPPLSVTFTDLSANTDSAKNTWHILTSEAYAVKSYTHEFLFSGSFSIGLTVGNSLGCTDFINKPSAITVFEKPTANFTVKPDIKEVEKELLLINNSRKANQYLWDFGDGNQYSQNTKNDTIYEYKDSGYYTVKLIAENDKGCKDTSTQLIRIHDRLYCAIPNAFTPGNNDDLNPVFMPTCTGVKNYTLTIYNRWGQIIQSCDNCGWDGTYMDKPVSSETYLYKIFITAESGKKETVFGTVNVVR